MEKRFEFEKLEVYKKAIQLIDDIYHITQSFPKSEQYGLTCQFRRTVTSIALNIAEGYGRYHKKLKQQFYFTAKASVYECNPILTISLNQNYINKSDHKKLYNQCLELSQMISGLIKSMDKRKIQ